jgi:hypothetical protein
MTGMLMSSRINCGQAALSSVVQEVQCFGPVLGEEHLLGHVHGLQQQLIEKVGRGVVVYEQDTG